MGMIVPTYNFPEPLVEKFVIKTYEEQYCQNDETKKVRVFKSVDQVKIDWCIYNLWSMKQVESYTGRGGSTRRLHHKHLALLSSAYDGGELGSTGS